MIGSFLFFGCEEEKDPVLNIDETTPPSLTSPGDNFVLLKEEADNSLATFSWSAADYGMPVANRYRLQMTMADSSYESGVDLVTTTDLSAPFTVGEMNQKVLQLGASPDEEIMLKFRIVSMVNEYLIDLISSDIQIAVTPYSEQAPPIYMIGAATGGWDPNLAVEVRNTDPNVYTTIAYFISDEAFRFFGQQDWGPVSYNYPHFAGGTVTDLLEDAMDGDNNFKFTGETGYYRITVGLDDLNVAMEAVDEPLMYITGEGIGGWDQPGTGVSLKMDFVTENVWVDTASFVADGAFRFFAQADWGPTSYNYPYFSEGSVDELLENAGDGDENFRFTGTSGSYVVTLNLNEPSVELEAVE